MAIPAIRLIQGGRQRITGVARFVRLKPFDTSTDRGRSDERYRRIVLTAMASAAAKGLSVFTALISVPLVVGYLGAERYGLWATISSTIALLGFADLGIGNGLLNALARANGEDDRNLARQYVSSGFFVLSGVAGLLAVLFAALYPYVPWPRVFNVAGAQAVAEAGPAVAVFVGCTLLNIPLGIAQRTQLAYQEGFANSMWGVLGSVLSLIAILIVIALRGGLPWLVLAMAGAPTLATAINGLHLFGFKHTWLRPAWQAMTSAAAKRILGLGSLFFVLQLAAAVGYQSNTIIIAQMLGADQVTQYAIPMKLFSFITMILSFVLTPLWPAYGEAVARHDVRWIKKTLSRSVTLTLLVALPPACLFVVLGRPLVHLWVGPAVTPSTLLLVGVGLWTLIYSVMSPIAMFLNGINVIRFQAVTASIMAAVNITISILLVRVIGVPGVLFGSVISVVFCSLIPVAIYLPRLLASIQQGEHAPVTA